MNKSSRNGRNKIAIIFYLLGFATSPSPLGLSGLSLLRHRMRNTDHCIHILMTHAYALLRSGNQIYSQLGHFVLFLFGGYSRSL